MNSSQSQKPAHTPGPWTVSENGSVRARVASVEAPIAQVFAVGHTTFEANKRLIEAAPDLAAALRMAYAALTEQCGFAQSTTAIRIRKVLHDAGVAI